MADTGSIKGQVINQRDGLPIPDAGVQLTADNLEKDTHSGNKGNFTFTDLAPGNKYALYIEKDGFYNGVYGPLVVVAGEATDLEVALQPATI